jgi:hypothetical protein
MTSHAAYAASRISSNLKGSTKQFGWLQAPATISIWSQELVGFRQQALLLFGKDFGKNLFLKHLLSCPESTSRVFIVLTRVSI